MKIWHLKRKKKLVTILISLFLSNVTCQFKVFPQTFEGHYPYYQGPPAPPVPQNPMEPYLAQAPYQGSYYSSSPSASVPWDGLKTYGDTTKQPGRYFAYTHVGPGCGSVMVRGVSFFIYFFNIMFLFCFSYSVHDGTEPQWRQQRWWLVKVLPVSVLYNNLLLLPVESAGPMFLSIFIVVRDGKRNIKHLLIGTANA